MRTCGKCRRPLRHDEHLSACAIEGWGNGLVCEACRAQAQGLEPPAPRRYPAGAPVPRLAGSDADMPVCGLCRVALVEGQRCQPMRLRPEFVRPEDGVECGGYAACPACVERWRPRILHYLIGRGLLPPAASVRQVTGGLLT